MTNSPAESIRKKSFEWRFLSENIKCNAIDKKKMKITWTNLYSYHRVKSEKNPHKDFLKLL